jgi:hypothetical protein
MILSTVAPPAPASDALLVLLWMSGAVGLILGIVGASLGYHRKIVIYAGRTDLHITAFSLVLLVCAGILVGIERETMGAFWLPLLLSVILGGYSFSRSIQANNTVWAGVLSIFAKYLLLVAITFCALLAVGGALGAVDEARKKRYKEAAANAGVAIAGAVGFVAVRQLINRLVTEKPANGRAARSTTTNPPAS